MNGNKGFFCKPSQHLSLVLYLAIVLLASPASAEILYNPEELAKNGELLVAQWEGDDAYDPFADYSEFEETEEEEADINFFRNGRLFTISLAATYRGFTGELPTIYDPQTGLGLYFTYFFDLRLAIMAGFSIGESALLIEGPTDSSTTSGTVSLTGVCLNLKYFFNTQNVKKGLARLNPYIIGGITQFSREERYDSTEEQLKDSAVSIDIGVGLEIPLVRGEFFFGLQGMYHYIGFADEGQEIILNGDIVNGSTGIFPSGDIFSFQGILGVNF